MRLGCGRGRGRGRGIGVFVYEGMLGGWRGGWGWDLKRERMGGREGLRWMGIAVRIPRSGELGGWLALQKEYYSNNYTTVLQNPSNF